MKRKVVPASSCIGPYKNARAEMKSHKCIVKVPPLIKGRRNTGRAYNALGMNAGKMKNN